MPDRQKRRGKKRVGNSPTNSKVNVEMEES